MEIKSVPLSHFNEFFSRLGWIHSSAKSGKYDIWTFPNNRDIWTLIPQDELSLEYKYYQDKNIKLILFSLNMDENETNYNEIYSQLMTFNYKLINRIVNQDSYKDDAVPYEIAVELPNKNISAFRTFYLSKTQGKQIPIESFKLNHTRYGSFIIPISIVAEINKADTFETIPSNTNLILREYLDIADTLTKIDITDEKRYADKIIDAGIDSRIVKDFLAKNDSIVKLKEKYKDVVKELTISSKSNPILDLHLTDAERTFKTVDLERARVIPENVLSYVEKREIEADKESLEEANAKIEVVVDSIDLRGTAKFTVYTINKIPLKKQFKASTNELSKIRLDFCADAFKSRDIIEIEGDILKAKGKVGKIVVDNIAVKIKMPGLFDEKSEEK